MLDITEIKKDLYRSKTMAVLYNYCYGNLYYIIDIGGEGYQFPISTIEEGPTFIESDSPMKTIKLSSDLGTTTFQSEIRGSELIRWITKANENGTLIKLT